MKCIIALLFVLMFVSTTTAQELTVTAYDYGTYSIYESPHDNTLYYRGQIDINSSMMLISHIEKLNANRLVISSPGGVAVEGLNMGFYLANKEGLSVEIPLIGNCVSACAYAVLGVKNLDIQGFLALHHPFMVAHSPDTTLSDIGKFAAMFALLMIQYMDDIGVNHNVVLDLYNKTDQSHYIVFESKKELDKYLEDVTMYDVKILSSEELKTVKQKD